MVLRRFRVEPFNNHPISRMSGPLGGLLGGEFGGGTCTTHKVTRDVSSRRHLDSTTLGSPRRPGGSRPLAGSGRSGDAGHGSRCVRSVDARGARGPARAEARGRASDRRSRSIERAAGPASEFAASDVADGVGVCLLEVEGRVCEVLGLAGGGDEPASDVEFEILRVPGQQKGANFSTLKPPYLESSCHSVSELISWDG